MNSDVIVSALQIGAPLAAFVGSMLMMPNALAPLSRPRAAVTLLAALLLTVIAVLLLQGNAQAASFTNADGALVALLLLTAGVAGAPLLDRARSGSLILAAPCVAFALMGALMHYQLSSGMLLAGLVLTSSVVALVGSALLVLHPARHTALGHLRPAATPQALLLLGWALLATSMLMLIQLLSPSASITPPILCAVIAAFAALLTTHAEDGLAKAGEALAAGVLLASIAPVSMAIAPCLGVVAGFFVNRSEAISNALRIDDPQHFTGALLIPAALGILLPGLLDTALLAPQLISLGTTLAIGIAVAAVLWPLLMLTTGLALPLRLVKAPTR